MPRRPARRTRAVLLALLLGAGPAVLPALPAAAGERVAREATVGYVRLAHLSPDTPAVDVYLTAPDAAQPRVFPAVGYGVVSRYLPVPAGRYAVAMRRAGAPARERPVLTTEVGVRAGQAYTVAGVGRHADLGLRVLTDDLSAPPAGRAKVRVIQASVRAPVLDVAATEGPVIAEGVQFATTTGYRPVAPGPWRLRLGGANGPRTEARVTLAPGAVYSLLVLDARRGGLTTELREDARGGTVVPAGGVDTGAGGLALHDGTRRPLGSELPQRVTGGPADDAGTRTHGDDGGRPSAQGDTVGVGRPEGAGEPLGPYPLLLGALVTALAVVGVLALRRRPVR